MWNDNEVKLVLNITPEYKVNKSIFFIALSEASCAHCSGRVDSNWHYFCDVCHLSALALRDKSCTNKCCIL